MLAVERRGGHRQLDDSTTRGPAIPNDLRVSSCAHTPPYWPSAAPMTASGLSLSAPLPNGRDNQSMAFFSTPGMLPLYSGVTTSAASASAAAAAAPPRRRARRRCRCPRCRTAGRPARHRRSGDAVGRRLRRQLGELTVDRCRPQAAYQRQNLDICHVRDSFRPFGSSHDTTGLWSALFPAELK